MNEIKIRPLTEEERKYTYAQSMQLDGQTGNIGYLRGDFGSSGKQFFSTWMNRWDRYRTDSFGAELDGVINALRSPEYGLLESRASMTDYVREHPDSLFGTDRGAVSGFRVDTGEHAYLIRCNPVQGDYNFYCYCYVSEFLDRHMANARKGIHFIDPHYKELFRIQETIEILSVAENGIFEVGRGRNTSMNKYSKSYRFTDINYTTANEEEQESIFERYCKFLNSLDCQFKITVNNKNKDMADLREVVLLSYKQDGFDRFRKIYNDIIEDKIREGRQGIEQERYLTLTVERKNFEEAKAQFATLEAVLHKAFGELGTEIEPLSGNERLKVLHDFYHLGREDGFDFDIRHAKKVGADFRNDLCNGMLKYFPEHIEDEGKFVRALFIKKYPSSLSDRFLNIITSLPVHSIVSIDVVPVPKDMQKWRIQ